MAWMRPRILALALLLGLSAVAAEPPLPDLRIEPAAGGSVFYIKNVASQPLTAYLIELVDYPGSSYSLWQDELEGQPIPPGGEKHINVTNMTVGAVPEYVKMRAALYADGTSSGIPEKVAQLVERRRFTLETTRELIRRLEKAQSSATPKAAVAADLKQWSDSLLPVGKAARNSPAAINQSAARAAIDAAIVRLNTQSIEDTLADLRKRSR